MASKDIFSFIDRRSDGLWTARYGHFTLKTAFQPIFRQKLDGELTSIGSEGLLRPYIDELAMAPAQFFAAADLPLVENVDCLARMIHVLNFANLKDMAQQSIFITFHPALLQSGSHICRELERLQICCDESHLNPSQIICQMSVQNLPAGERLSFFAAKVRDAGFKLTISHIDSGAYAMPMVFTLRPHYIKLTGEWIKLASASPAAANLLRRIIERCAVEEIEPILTGVENKELLSQCRQLHPVNLQGLYLCKPTLAHPELSLPSASFALAAPARRSLRQRSARPKLFPNAYLPNVSLLKLKGKLFGKRRPDS
jgi:EAL domain-containing protein (putative c-di-GMP-specific phosphodiesterase class I)